MYETIEDAKSAWRQVWEWHTRISETDPVPEIGKDLPLEESAALYEMLPEDDEWSSVDDFIESLPLTRKQKELLRHKSAGLTNAQIAEILNVTERAVEMRLQNIRKRLGGEDA